MDIGQAVRRLRSVYRIRRKSWEDEDRWLDLDRESLAEAIDPALTYDDLLASDWEEEENVDEE